MLFNPVQIGAVCAPNRLWRAATYEGLADAQGRPAPALGDLYARLAAGGAGAIITGFCFVSPDGRAMQPRQAGIDSDDAVAPWRAVTQAGHAAGRGTLLFMQLAHAGRQTIPAATGGRVFAPSRRRSPYFRSRPEPLDEERIRATVATFVAAARRARQAGFDGVELHAAHGYLIHQFLSPHLNTRRDVWGRDRPAFLREVLNGIRTACGAEFPVLVKLSAGDFHRGGIDVELAAEYAARLEELGVAAIEVSCGTMDLAMNIFRGGLPITRALAHNPLLAELSDWQRSLWMRFALPRLRRHLLPFTEAYNRAAARTIRARIGIPLILVGGLRTRTVMEEVLAARDADVLALCRPWIREPDLGERLRAAETGRSACVNCNVCAVMCDSAEPLHCYQCPTAPVQEGATP